MILFLFIHGEIFVAADANTRAFENPSHLNSAADLFSKCYLYNIYSNISITTTTWPFDVDGRTGDPNPLYLLKDRSPTRSPLVFYKTSSDPVAEEKRMKTG